MSTTECHLSWQSAVLTPSVCALTCYFSYKCVQVKLAGTKCIPFDSVFARGAISHYICICAMETKFIFMPLLHVCPMFTFMLYFSLALYREYFRYSCTTIEGQAATQAIVNMSINLFYTSTLQNQRWCCLDSGVFLRGILLL